jgi:TM2 domain-containing membrane protein YozV
MQEDELYPAKNLLVAYLLWLPPLGILGAHKFYLSRPFLGVAYFFTGGLLLIGWIYDLFTLPRQTDEFNERIDEFLDYHDLEIEALEDEIEDLRERLSSQGVDAELHQVKARVRELEQQLANARNQQSESTQSDS